MITADQWRALFPDAHPDILGAFIDQMPELAPKFGVDGGAPLALFLAQIGHESGGLTIRTESMDYRAARIVEVWPTRFRSIADAAPFAHNGFALAEHVYGGRMGNGPEGSGDGFNRRGRGPVQITGLDDDKAVQDHTGLPLVAHPELAIDPRNGPLTALGFWASKNITSAVNAATSLEAALLVSTRLINGGLIGLASRRDWLDRVNHILAPKEASPAALAAPHTVRLRTKGAAVALLQRLLNAKGAGLHDDGDAGPATIAALIAFQDRAGLTADGVAGPTTWAALKAA